MSNLSQILGVQINPKLIQEAQELDHIISLTDIVEYQLLNLEKNKITLSDYCDTVEFIGVDIDEFIDIALSNIEMVDRYGIKTSI